MVSLDCIAISAEFLKNENQKNAPLNGSVVGVE